MEVRVKVDMVNVVDMECDDVASTVNGGGDIGRQRSV